jgi:SRSO17 transposase
MSDTCLLEHPEAQALLADAEVSAADVRGCRGRLRRFLQRYLPLFYREEQRELAEVVVQGKLTNLRRKTSEPIAYQAGRHRKPVQHFVGAGAWDDDAVQAELRRDVAATWGDPEAVMVLDGSGFPKKGNASCGVARQWCGRLGKVDNCQVGVFLAYVTPKGATLVDRRLYLPQDWAADRKRRRQAHVPKAIRFQEGWRIGLDLLDRAAIDLPFGWVTGDVPCDTRVRDIDEPPEPGKRYPPWRRADAWAQALPASRWRRVRVGDGAQGPKEVRLAEAWVQTKDSGGRVGALERLVVLRTLDREPRTWYTLSNAPGRVAGERLAQVHGQRHGVEEALQAGKGEVGLAHYEVRSWVGWHHHMTLSLLALWFLAQEKQRLGKKNPGPDGAAAARGVRAAIAAAAAECPADRRRSQPGVTPQ